jgi:uncharacterized protein
MVEPNLAGGITGGALIGLASVLLLASSGRVAGISGILGGLYGKWTESDLKWRLLFLVGLIAGAGLVAAIQGGLQQTLQANSTVLIIAGLLVGFGTRLGGGCTSGHGVCGLAKRAKRSFVATILFMASAMVTVYIIRHVLS